MAKPTIGRFRLLFLFLLPIPLAWTVFSESPWFRAYFKPLENLAMDWRYRVRGPIDAPEVKVAYADVDAPTINLLGERPWPRWRMAQVAKILFDLGQAKAVGYDFIYSTQGVSQLVDQDKFLKSDIAFRQVLDQYPNIVLAANYTTTTLPPVLGENGEPDLTAPPALSIAPIRYLRDPGSGYTGDSPEEAATFPEMPSFPIWSFERGSNGIGLIAADEYLSAGPTPRWATMFTRADGPYYTLNLLKGMQMFRGFEWNTNFILTSAEEFREFKQAGVLPGLDALPDAPTVLVYNERFQPEGAFTYETQQTFYHFSIELALKYLGLDHDDVAIEDDAIVIRRDDGSVFREIPLTYGQICEVNWFSPWEDEARNPRASVEAIFQMAHARQKGTPREQEIAEQFFERFRDAIVLIGPVDPTLQDVAPTPFDTSPKPKVGVYGNMLKTIFSGEFITRLPWWKDVFLLFALTYAVAALGTYSGRHSGWAKAGSAVVLFGYAGLVFAVFDAFHLVLPLLAPVASAITTTTAGAIYQLIVEEKQRGRIKDMFGTYLSPDLVNQMVDAGQEPTLGGEEVEITAFFSDIQSFSTFSEKLPADRLVALMNEYLTAMTDILQEERGTLDKYIGDAMVAMFNAPLPVDHHALRACVAAARIQKKQLELRAKWSAEGDHWPEIVTRMQTRIGLNTGTAVVGNMGSETRFNYTMMGDTVNLAARSESGAKSYGVYIMVTGEVKRAAEADGNDCVFRYLDKIIVKGRSLPAEMYELVCLHEDLDPETTHCLELYAKGVERYRAKDFAGAITFFEQSVELEPNRPEKNPDAPTTPSDVLLARCLYYLEEPPPANWDGVFVMKTK